MELNREPINLSADEKRKYLFLKQIHTLEAFRERNAISKKQYDKQALYPPKNHKEK